MRIAFRISIALLFLAIVLAAPAQTNRVAANTKLAANEIQIDPCCAFIPME